MSPWISSFKTQLAILSFLELKGAGNSWRIILRSNGVSH